MIEDLSAQDTSTPSTSTPTPTGQTGVHYEIFVRAFCDSNGDGIGDLNGVTSKLDYLKDLGISAIWLMPINPSPSYHMYDVTDYYGIAPEYGTMDDFRRLVSEAHRRGMKVILDFVINHTSRRHPWFVEACKGKDNPYHDWYVWMTQKEIDSLNIATREITADSQEKNPWHRVPGAPFSEKYYALFWSGMPDLNYDNPKVREEIYKAGKFWLTDVGVDGFRLDAARHIYPDWEEPKNHQFWEEFGQVMEAAKPGVYTVGEVWTRAERIAPYFRGLKANFNFDLSLALQEIPYKERDTAEVVQMLARNHSIFAEVNPNFIDAIMLSNHDQSRIGSLLNGNQNHLKVAANLLLTLPGNPYVYYGEEIGMLGAKPDENIREPFLWDEKKKDRERSRWRRPSYSTDATVMPLAQQQTDPDSLYNHYKRLIHFRNSHPVLNDNLSKLEVSEIRQKNVIAFTRKSKNRSVLVIHNLTKRRLDVVLYPIEIAEGKKIVLDTVGDAKFGNDGNVRVPAYGCVVLE
ncbi:alpha-amylase family glycosyl hydrolase [Larkinella terrae]|uniref:Alpha-amylase n=1 Tax=Larkinella terrae TaxID=2025311 RepID=A0A7K0ESB0_9BACT|nr:alpha-amylase family glycosyl hydrolase [Larkinella terrae]MRS64690.1 alpha-amylase [Larkinella terrae]